MQSPTLPKRLHSLDAFRGLTIAGMLLVNQASLMPPVHSWLAHADWHGLTPADLVFPFFLFIVGAAMAFSLAKYTQGQKPAKAVYWRILRRGLLLFGLGLFLNGFWTYDWSTLRVMGVLQRIGLAYTVTALLVLYLPRKAQWIVTAALLGVYWLAMMVFPGAGDLSHTGNFGAIVDRAIIPAAHLYGGAFKNMADPEGLFSTLGAIASTLLGYFTGTWLRATAILKGQRTSSQSMTLVLFGLSSIVLGQLWGLFFPVNKNLWTSSYVLVTAGFALVLLAACFELIEVRQRQRWSQPLQVLGQNSIFIFVASILLIKILVKTKVGPEQSLNDWLYQHLFLSWVSGPLAGFLFAVAILLFWWWVAYIMYWRNWLLRI